MKNPATSKTEAIEIAPFDAACLGRVVALHRQAFPTFFLSFLGPRFLREFYASYLVDPTGFAFVACDGAGEVVGVVAGSVDPRGYFGRLVRRRWWAFALASVTAVMTRPTSFPRLLAAVFYRGDQPAGPVRALLSSIAVSPAAQGRGIGKRLMQAWLSEAGRRGAVGCYLTTDALENEVVNACYRSFGWRLENSYQTPQGRWMNRYTFDFKRLCPSLIQTNHPIQTPT